MITAADHSSAKLIRRFVPGIERGSPTVSRRKWIAKKVRDVEYDHHKLIKFEDGSSLILHRFACVGPRDVVMFVPTESRRLYVACKNGTAKLRPIYRRHENFILATQPIKVTFKEIETEEELEGYKRLSDFHYRGVILHGRRVPLVATVDHPFLPRVIGYVELATTFIMNKPRSKVLHAEFSDGNGLSWKKWDLRAMRTKTNLITRIARCVVYPELRGLGLSRLLLEHAFQYARRHWQIAGLKPYFIEITADMLKYLPFAEKAGMAFVGYTEGNLKRLQKDMQYILGNYQRVKKREILREESAGIVDLQVSYAAKLKGIVDNGGPNLRTALRLMNFKGDRVSSTQYAVLHELLRLPKPTYLKGLTGRSERFVQKRVRELKVQPAAFEADIHIKPLKSSVVLSDVTLSVRSRVRQTAKSRAVQEAFGIKPEHLNYPVISNLSLEIAPRSTILIMGPSGSGKTLLLSAIAGHLGKSRQLTTSRIILSGSVRLPGGVKVGKLRRISDNRPLVELFGRRDIKRAIYVLNMAGLSEAYLYLRRFDELSAGQQYRAMIAKMVDAERNLWVADEFCSTLDPLTAYTVAHNLKKLSQKFGATLIVAAPHCNHFVRALRPTTVVYLMSGREHRIFKGDEFVQHFSGRNPLFGTAG